MLSFDFYFCVVLSPKNRYSFISLATALVLIISTANAQENSQDNTSDRATTRLSHGLEVSGGYPFIINGNTPRSLKQTSFSVSLDYDIQFHKYLSATAGVRYANGLTSLIESPAALSNLEVLRSGSKLTSALGVQYNFLPMTGKWQNSIFHPYVGVSLGFSWNNLKYSLDQYSYRVSGDSIVNSYYHYWSDGTIRGMPEGLGNASIIERDNIYETVLPGFTEDDFSLAAIVQVGVRIRLFKFLGLVATVDYQYDHWFGNVEDVQIESIAYKTDEHSVLVNLGLYFSLK